MNEQQFFKILDAIDGMQQIQAAILADTHAMFAIVRALADANAENPVFVASLKHQVEHRLTRRLNAAEINDKQIEDFRESLKYLLPQSLRDI
ncbi:hypothetical protein [Caballeronia sp. LZ035]|uniref:hypothetical protein n=1 Tax=Caballeronia sp. LZ035 TaxID=3038568 RepID=UPI002857335D|nr:hypothetical protein [Caballeronia sp. LZ035]MDR5761930.1 hypothetical protein [Caballeronia sp. LZ035]